MAELQEKDLLQVIENGPVATKQDVQSQSAPQDKTATPAPVRSAAGDKNTNQWRKKSHC